MVVLSGHRHNYERFARQDADAATDPAGIRQFVAGTGGGEPHLFEGAPVVGSEARADSILGVLK